MPSATVPRPPGLTTCFPTYTEDSTIASMVVSALVAARALTDDHEVILVAGASPRDVPVIVDELPRAYPEVRVVHGRHGAGYGGALRSGIEAASKELVFSTNGDGRYDPSDLASLWRAMTDRVDLVCGYRTVPTDPAGRAPGDRRSQRLVRSLFGLSVRDPGCDSRLMRRSMFESVVLTRDGGGVRVEMLKKIQDAGFRIAEVPVRYDPRPRGTRSRHDGARSLGTPSDLLGLWIDLIVHKTHLRDLAARTATVTPGRGRPHA
jgi:glycosyltransferase involved in cell wall biosynthesis